MQRADRAMLIVRAWTRRSAGDRRLLAEAMLWLQLAAAAIALRPFRKVVGLGAIALPGLPAPDRATVAAIVRAVDAAARHSPSRALCFEQGLAAQRMLRRRGADARLHYGIALGTPLRAHVWVTLGDEIILGGATRDQFREVAAWP